MVRNECQRSLNQRAGLLTIYRHMKPVEAHVHFGLRFRVPIPGVLNSIPNTVYTTGKPVELNTSNVSKLELHDICAIWRIVIQDSNSNSSA